MSSQDTEDDKTDQSPVPDPEDGGGAEDDPEAD
jgi:hypothetical protein